MNTREAYEQFKKGKRVVVLVTGWSDELKTELTTAHEIPGDAWARRVKNQPNANNYALLVEN